jgi:hypothetical protein
MVMLNKKLKVYVEIGKASDELKKQSKGTRTMILQDIEDIN